MKPIIIIIFIMLKLFIFMFFISWSIVKFMDILRNEWWFSLIREWLLKQFNWFNHLKIKNHLWKKICEWWKKSIWLWIKQHETIYLDQSFGNQTSKYLTFNSIIRFAKPFDTWVLNQLLKWKISHQCSFRDGFGYDMMRLIEK